MVNPITRDVFLEDDKSNLRIALRVEGYIHGGDFSVEAEMKTDTIIEIAENGDNKVTYDYINNFYNEIHEAYDKEDESTKIRYERLFFIDKKTGTITFISDNKPYSGANILIISKCEKTQGENCFQIGVFFNKENFYNKVIIYGPAGGSKYRDYYDFLTQLYLKLFEEYSIRGLVTDEPFIPQNLKEYIKKRSDTETKKG